MITIICTAMVCVTVLLVSFSLCRLVRDLNKPAQQPNITDEDLAKAYREAEADKIPDFQDVISFINKEFTGVEDGNE